MGRGGIHRQHEYGTTEGLVATVARAKDSIVGLELGKALADRLGLDPDTTDMEWSAVNGGSDTVYVRFVTLARMPAHEFNDLLLVAKERAGVR